MKDGLTNTCKECHKIHKAKYHKTIPTILDKKNALFLNSLRVNFLSLKIISGDTDYTF